VRRLYNRLDAGSLEFPLLPEDVADSTRLTLPHGAARERDTSRPLTVGWVCTPPAAGSGGHTTLFRMVAGMEALGHRCVLFLYDRHGGDLQRHARVLHENWPDLHAEIRDATDGITSVDAAVASSWETAHVLVSRSTAPIPLLYFIQDFEPFFYPRGSLQALAEDSYRFGFVNIALGDMVAQELSKLDLDCVVAPFGCDTATYNVTRTEARSGVVFYAKRAVDRRAYILGKWALEEFHARHPEQPIHLCGDPVDDWPIPTIQHHRLSPSELNDLYNQTVAGIAMSFTNISLVAEEMLAAGTIPIVNDSPYSRADLPNEHVEWARPTAGGIAEALCRVVEDPDVEKRSIDASQSVRDGWGPAQAIVAATIVGAVASDQARGASSAAGRR